PLFLFFVVLSILLPAASAVYINFDNCLDQGYKNAPDPVRLQFVPLHVNAKFNTSAPSHNLNVTIFGNVKGQSISGDYPLPNSTRWQDPKDNFGKIIDYDPNTVKYTTLFENFKVLTYTAYEPKQGSIFCQSTVNTACPMGPRFDVNESNVDELPGFTVAHNFYSSYAFATFALTVRITSGDSRATTLGCVSASITPDLGSKLADALCYLPAAVLALVAIATVFAATCSPWGTSDIFRWSSNYGRDEDLIRLVTPGFGDCLQYIQFIVLAGSLNLSYPGFFQPVVSQASWSVLLFNESLVSHGGGARSLVDGIYFANGTYGLSRLGQYVGMSEEQDIWAGMAVWLLGLIAAVTIIAQLAFFARWGYRRLTNNPDVDMRGKNWPFTAGNIVRIVFNFFMLPIVTLSLFQLVVARRSPASVVAMAVILLIAVIGIAVWIFWFMFTTRPRAHLFDDLPTVLTYGPLYNTYSDDAAPFAFIPVLLTAMRGIAIGAIQPSGIAQIIILAICEVILILTLHAFRPFQSNTSMNAYHTFFAAIRLVSTTLMIAFVPSLGVLESSKGWIGYAILMLHAVVLVFGFFLNSLQTLVEVSARLAGAGTDQRGGLTKVFGMRQLSRRNQGSHRKQRSSLNSDAAMLTDGDAKSGGRSRSLSASSAALLNQQFSNNQRGSVGFDGETTPGTPGTNATPFSFIGGSSAPSSRRPTMGTMDNDHSYYRPPRPRKHTLEGSLPGARARNSGGSTDLTNTPYADNVEQAETGDIGEGPSSWSPNRSTITPAYLRMHRDDSDPALAERRKNTDYSVRESDFYYGLRGPALSENPTRKLKTGPADPMGPVSSATGWFRSLPIFGAKKKEKGKGFEVVRSTRIPPQMMPLEEDDESPTMPPEPYKDSPTSPAKKPYQVSSGQALGAGAPQLPGKVEDDDDTESTHSSDEESFEPRANRVSDIAPTLGPIETGAGIELPSRIGSRASHASRVHGGVSRAPTLPRKSSRRTPSTDRAIYDSASRLSTVVASPPGTPLRGSDFYPHSNQHLQPNQGQLPVRLPFGSSEPSPSPERSPGHSTASSTYHDAGSDYNQMGLNDGSLQPPRPIDGGDRPLSTGYVHQHMARDGIHTYDAGTHLEASAEFVDRSQSMSTHRSRRS
ncbi:hypothetical protein P154DRAFT_401763, partial [Amniculicola lignicola CBS 123094]